MIVARGLISILFAPPYCYSNAIVLRSERDGDKLPEAMIDRHGYSRRYLCIQTHIYIYMYFPNKSKSVESKIIDKTCNKSQLSVSR